MQGLKRLVPAVVAIAAIAAPSSAFAQQASESGYSHSDGVVVNDTSGNHTGDATATADDPGSVGGSLPFTGLDALLLALAGTGLAAIGVGMRYLTRSPESA